MNTAFQILRIVAVIALVCVAAALATPKGRLPLALRGVLKLMRKDNAVSSASCRTDVEEVPVAKRLLAFVLVLLAVLLAIA